MGTLTVGQLSEAELLKVINAELASAQGSVDSFDVLVGSGDDLRGASHLRWTLLRINRCFSARPPLSHQLVKRRANRCARSRPKPS